MDKKTKKDIVGYVAVDSGQVLIVDPCYLDEWRKGEYADEAAHYRKCCDITLSESGAGQITIAGRFGDGVTSRTHSGDGNYPVYAERDADGRIKSLTIKFTR